MGTLRKIEIGSAKLLHQLAFPHHETELCAKVGDGSHQAAF